MLYPLSYGGFPVVLRQVISRRTLGPTAVRQGAGRGVPPRAVSSSVMVVVSAVWVSAIVAASRRTAVDLGVLGRVHGHVEAALVVPDHQPQELHVERRPGQLAQPGELLLGRHPRHQGSAVAGHALHRVAGVAPSSPIQAMTSPPEGGSPQRESQPSIRPAWLVWIEEMSKASDRIVRDPRCARARRWPSPRPAGGAGTCPARSRRRPSPSRAWRRPGRCRGPPPARRRAAPGPRAMTASEGGPQRAAAGLGRPRSRVSSRRRSADQGAGVPASPASGGSAMKSGFSQLAPTSGC